MTTPQDSHHDTTTGLLDGRRALITGAAGGIARATAVDFARHGAQVVVTDLNVDGARDTAEAVIAAGGSATALGADVTDEESVGELVDNAVAVMGGLDILVTCAGGFTAYSVQFDEIPFDDWNKIIALNLHSVFLCCKAVAPHMKANGWGRIINLGSLAGRSTSVGSSPAHYGTAKAGVSMLTQYIAKDLAPFGITANTVAPGTTETDRVRRMLTPEKEETFVKMTPVGRLAEPEDMSDVITFLASDASRYVTGVTLDVNGGRLMLV